MLYPQRIGHIVLNVKDVEESTAFYTDVLGFQIVSERPIGTFLTCGKIHHDLALFQASKDAQPIIKGALGLNHMALQVEDFGMLTEYYLALKDSGIIERTIDHGMTSSIYLTDPDGNGIELFCNNQENPVDGLEIMRNTSRENTELVFPHLNSF